MVGNEHFREEFAKMKIPEVCFLPYLGKEKWSESSEVVGDLGFRATGFTSVLSMSPTHPES